jgi:hypothetical protein
MPVPQLATGPLRVHGQGFVQQSPVRISRPDTDVLEPPTTFVSPTELTAALSGRT